MVTRLTDIPIVFKVQTGLNRTGPMKKPWSVLYSMTSPEQAAHWSMATGYMGVSPSSYQTEALRNYVKDFPPAVVARDQLNYATAELSTFQTGRVRKLLDDAIQSALTGNESPKQALEKAQKSAERLLRRYQ